MYLSDLVPEAANSTSCSKHLIDRFLEARAAGLGPKTMVIGHRGGYIDGPENSMKCFRAAIEHNLEGIEFDVSCCDREWTNACD